MDSHGVQANDSSAAHAVSANGRYVAFESLASNLVHGDTNGGLDIFVHDRLTRVTERVSVDSFGAEADLGGSHPSISADGRYVAFYSSSTNLVPGDTNSAYDVFVHDRQSARTERVSVDSFGQQGDFKSRNPSISEDGRYVAFYSRSTNLVAGDNNGFEDTFVHDRQTGVTVIVSVDSFGAQGNEESASRYNIAPSISADGRYVAFVSEASNLVPADSNLDSDVFVHDRQTGKTERVSVDSFGAQADGESLEPSISACGRYVAFRSISNGLVPGGTLWNFDIFVHDRQAGETEQVSLNSLDGKADGHSYGASISADGRYVAFESSAGNLMPVDTLARPNVFVHDRQTGVTETVNKSSTGDLANQSCVGPVISASGRYVSFLGEASNLVEEDTNDEYDIFVHDRWNGLGTNSIYLTGPSTSPVSAPMQFSWHTTRGNSRYWLLFSQNRSGSIVGGHRLDIGNRNHHGLLNFGIHPSNGVMTITSPQPSSFAAGHTIYFEVAAQDAKGILFDSNVHAVTFY